MLPGWTYTELQGHRVDLFQPENASTRTLLYLHPVGGEVPSTDSIMTETLHQLGWRCCVPHGNRSWWSNRICHEFDHELTAERWLLDVVQPWIKTHWQISDNAIALAGISMGGQAALRLGFLYPERFRVVASIAGAFEYERLYGQGTPIDTMYPSREACRQDTAILQIRGGNVPPEIWFACDPADDPWIIGNDRLAEKLQALGISFSADLETSHGGHTWTYFHAMFPLMLQTIGPALDRQKWRLL